MTELMVGGLHFRAHFLTDHHCYVDVRGHGEPGQRPLLGQLSMTLAEWSRFVEAHQ